MSFSAFAVSFGLSHFWLLVMGCIATVLAASATAKAFFFGGYSFCSDLVSMETCHNFGPLMEPAMQKLCNGHFVMVLLNDMQCVAHVI